VKAVGEEAGTAWDACLQVLGTELQRFRKLGANLLHGPGLTIEQGTEQRAHQRLVVRHCHGFSLNSVRL
jgi:hypothetical protein